MERRYWTINLDDFSVSINTSDLVVEDEVVDLAIKHGVIDKDDVKNSSKCIVEDITDDEYDMKFWVSQSVAIDD